MKVEEGEEEMRGIIDYSGIVNQSLSQSVNQAVSQSPGRSCSTWLQQNVNRCHSSSATARCCMIVQVLNQLVPHRAV